jgi:hypothetical protein
MVMTADGEVSLGLMFEELERRDHELGSVVPESHTN